MHTVHTVFLASLLVGLLLGVFFMLHGVERAAVPGPGSGARPDAESKASLKLPLVAAFATLFGLSGYLLTRYAQLPTPAELSIAATLGALGSLGAAALVMKWAIPSARQEVVDERYLLQGSPARVTRPIGTDSPGAIEYESDGTHVVSEARSLDGSPIEVGTEVVIERVEQGTAYVERWALVEARL